MRSMPSVPIVTHPEVAAPTEDGGTSTPDTSEHPALLTRVPSLQQPDWQFRVSYND